MSVSTAGPLICSQFDPSNTYLASAIVALDSHQIKVQSVNASQSSLDTSFNLDSGLKITCLSWVSFGEQQLVALALNNGSVLIYSPFTNQIIAELVSTTNLSITDFHYSPVTSSAWSSDINGNLFEWDMDSFTLIRQFAITDLLETSESINKISSITYDSKPHLLVGSHSVYLVDLDNLQIIKTFPAHVQPISNIYPVPDNTDLFFTSAKNDRFINLYSIQKNSTKAIFVSQLSISLFSLGIKDEKTSILLVINEAGNLEAFQNPLNNDPQSTPASPSSTPTQSKKRRRHQLNAVQSRSSNAYVKLSRPSIEIKNPNDSNLIINSITINHDSIIYSWLEHSSVAYFDTLKWLDESNNFLLKGDIMLEKSRPNLKSSVSHSEKGHDVAATKHYKEGNAIITEGSQYGDVANVTDDEEEEEETLADKLDKLSTDQQKNLSNNSNKKKNRSSKKSNTATLTIILAQSLKNNDHSLLESVLVNRDPNIVQNTIARLDSSLAVILLDRLSERITRQTSRFDQLNFWLKWIIIIHGGVLSSLPNLNTKLANLHAILSKKANTLPRLLELQGRLTMLHQQVDLKKEILNGDQFVYTSDNENEDAVEYVEEIDDAQFKGELSEDDEDLDMDDLQDDYEDSESENDDALDQSDVEGNSDIDADGATFKDDVMLDDDDLVDAESASKLKKHLKSLKKNN